MRIVLTRQPDMKILSPLKKLINNPWVGTIVSLAFIISSLYKILDDITIFRKEYLILAAALPVYIKSLKKIFDQMIDISNDKSD